MTGIEYMTGQAISAILLSDKTSTQGFFDHDAIARKAAEIAISAHGILDDEGLI